MIIRQTDRFTAWLENLRDNHAKARIVRRIYLLMGGNPGDVKPVGDGISEMRIDYGPGYRVYYAQRGNITLLLLCGGDKRTQARDIETAKKLAKEFKER